MLILSCYLLANCVYRAIVQFIVQLISILKNGKKKSIIITWIHYCISITNYSFLYHLFDIIFIICLIRHVSSITFFQCGRLFVSVCFVEVNKHRRAITRLWSVRCEHQIVRPLILYFVLIETLLACFLSDGAKIFHTFPSHSYPVHILKFFIHAKQR